MILLCQSSSWRHAIKKNSISNNYVKSMTSYIYFWDIRKYGNNAILFSFFSDKVAPHKVKNSA